MSQVTLTRAVIYWTPSSVSVALPTHFPQTPHKVSGPILQMPGCRCAVRTRTRGRERAEGWSEPSSVKFHCPALSRPQGA